MARCETCGSDYDRSIVVIKDGERHVYDCFECAVHALAPICAHCGCRIIGHGIEAENSFFCCHHCAEDAGVYARQGEVHERA